MIWVANNSGIDRLDGDRFVTAFRPQDRADLAVAGEGPLGDLYVVLEPFGISRLKASKLMGIARLDGSEIQVVQQDLWLAGGTGGVTRVGAASLRSWEANRRSLSTTRISDASTAFCRTNAPADIRI